MRSLSFPLPLIAALLSGCALFSTWHWEKPGAEPEDYEFDVTYCKLQTYSGTDGNVTHASVRQMHRCLEGKGWRKVAN